MVSKFTLALRLLIGKPGRKVSFSCLEPKQAFTHFGTSADPVLAAGKIAFPRALGHELPPLKMACLSGICKVALISHMTLMQ